MSSATVLAKIGAETRHQFVDFQSLHLHIHYRLFERRDSAHDHRYLGIYKPNDPQVLETELLQAGYWKARRR